MSAQESAKACADYIRVVYNSPLDTRESAFGLTEEGNRVIEQFGTATSDMIEWQVDPQSSSIEVVTTAELHELVQAYLLADGIAFSVMEDGTISVIFP